VGDILRSPSERADPLESEEANVTDVSAMAESVTKLPKGSSDSSSPRQPPIVSDTTAAAFPRSTHVTPLHSCPLGEVGCELEPEVLTSESEPSTCSSVTVQFNNYASLATDHSRCTKCIVLNNLNKTAVLLCVGIKVPENLTRYDLLISQWEQENVGHVAHEVVT